MPNRRVLLAVLAATAALAVPPAALANAPGAADPAQVVAEARERLKLTPEQEAQLKPIVQERNQKLEALREKYAGDTSRSGRRALFRDAKPIQQAYEQQVRAILTPEQQSEWEMMRKEAWQRMQDRQGAGGAPE